MKIDIHAHLYPERYLAELERYGVSLEAPCHQAWKELVRAKVRADPRMWSIGPRLEEMDRVGVDMQVLSLSIPNVFFDDPLVSLRLARIANDAFAEVCHQYPDRFRGFASIPLNHPDLALEELRRAVDDLGLHGVVLGGNVNGMPLNAPAFMPFYEELHRRNLSIFMHPMMPVSVETMLEYNLAASVGYLFDSTLAATRMVFAGIFERWPNIDLVIPHLGAAIPYIWARIEASYATRPEARKNIPHPPSHYFRRFYYDTVSYHPPALRCACETVGASQLVLGSDYPFDMGDITRSIADVQALGLTATEEELIFSGNALKVLRQV